MAFYSRKQLEAQENYKKGVKMFEDNPRRQFTWQEMNEMIHRNPVIPALALEPPKKDSVCSLWFSWIDEKQKVVETKQSESFVANFLRMINVFSIQQSIVNTSGTAKSFTAGSQTLDASAAQSTTVYGIVVGRSGISVLISNVAIASKINQGTTSGLLQYGAMSWSSTQVNAPSATLQGNRTFTNGAVSGPLSVLEAGIICLADTTNLASGSVLIVRDTTNQTIASGQTNTAQYTFKVTA